MLSFSKLATCLQNQFTQKLICDLISTDFQLKLNTEVKKTEVKQWQSNFITLPKSGNLSDAK